MNFDLPRQRVPRVQLSRCVYTEDGEKASWTGKEREQKGEASEKARERGREAEDFDSRSSRLGRSGCAGGRVCVTKDTGLCLLAAKRGSEEGRGYGGEGEDG